MGMPMFSFYQRQDPKCSTYVLTAIPDKTFVQKLDFFERMTKDRLGFEFQ